VRKLQAERDGLSEKLQASFDESALLVESYQRQIRSLQAANVELVKQLGIVPSFARVGSSASVAERAAASPPSATQASLGNSSTADLQAQMMALNADGYSQIDNLSTSD
jgi:hypothetical protein